jgi:hypothetical protein
MSDKSHAYGGHAKGIFSGDAGAESKRKMGESARSEHHMAVLARMQANPEIQARRLARVAEAQRNPEWRKRMGEILAKARTPEAIERARQRGYSEENLKRLKLAALKRESGNSKTLSTSCAWITSEAVRGPKSRR